MYNIVLECWYLELLGTRSEIYKGLEFETMEFAALYMAINMEEILDSFPVVSISIEMV